MRSLTLLLLMIGLVVADDSYSLNDCRRLAREKNAEVRTAHMELESATETRKSVFTKYFPQVSTTAGVLATKDPFSNIKTPEMNLPVYNGDPSTLGNASQFAYMPSLTLNSQRWASDLSLTVVQPLYVGGRVVIGNQLASLGEDVARSKITQALQEAQAQAEEKYWALLSLQEKQRTLNAYDTMLASLSFQVEDAVAHGLTTRNDLLKVHLKIGEIRNNRLQLESGLRLAVRDLRQHLGLDEDTTMLLSDTLAIPQDPTQLAGVRRGAVERRVEAKLLGQSVRAEELQADMEQGSMLPSVLVGGDASYMKISGLDASTNLTVFGVVSMPISDLWASCHNTEVHRIKARQARLQESETRRKMDLGISKDWDDLVRNFQSSLLADETVEQAEENLREESDRYKNGLAVLSDLLDAQAMRQQAQDHRIDARKDYWLARAAYLRSTATDSRFNY